MSMTSRIIDLEFDIANGYYVDKDKYNKYS